MHFSKKLAFLQYWLYYKKPNRTTSSLVYSSNYKLEVSRSNINMPVSFISNPNYLFSKNAQRCSVLSTKNSYHNISNTKLNDLSLKLDANLNLTKPEISIITSLPEQKPWYAYWVLPLVGFIFVLPSFIPSSKTDSSYGFKYLNSSPKDLYNKINILQPSISTTQNFYIPNKTQTLKPIIGNNILFPNRIGQYLNYKERYESLFLSKQENNIRQNNFTNLVKLTNKINTFSLSSDNINMINNRVQLGPSASANVEYKDFASNYQSSIDSCDVKSNFSIMTNDMIFVQKENCTIKKNISSLSESFNLKEESAINIYKKYQQYTDILIKQLTISCDRRFIQAIQDLELSNSLINNYKSFIDSKKTKNILVFFKEQIFNFNKQYNSKIDLINKNKNKRFLQTYNESLFFYTYFNNVVLNKSKYPQVILLKGPLLKSSYSLNNEYINTTYSKNLSWINNLKLTKTSHFNQPKLENFTKLSYSNYLITNQNHQTNQLSSEVLNYDNSNVETIIISKTNEKNQLSNNTKNQSILSNLTKQNSQEKLKNYLDFINLQLVKNIQKVKYLRNKNEYISRKIKLVDKNKIYKIGENKIPTKRRKFYYLKANNLLQFRQRINLYQDTNKTIKSNYKSQEQIMRNSLLPIFKQNKISSNKIYTRKLLSESITNLNKNNTNLGALTSYDEYRLESYNQSKIDSSDLLLINNQFESKDPVANAYPSLKGNQYFSLIESSNNPLDILRLKHFIFLQNYEKDQLKTFKNLEAILKDEKILYEAVTRQAQKQKRRKKKRKRWTRRRRKRKRKLLRPLWSTIRLMHKYYAKRLLINSSNGITKIPSANPLVFANAHIESNYQLKIDNCDSLSFIFDKRLESNYQSKDPKSPLTEINLTKGKKIKDFELYKYNFINADKNVFLLSKRTLQELTGTLVKGNMVSPLRNSKLTSKRTLKTIELYNIQKAKKLLNRKILQFVNFKNHNKKWNIQKHSISSIVGTTTKLNNIVEHNRIMHERLQRILINNATTKDFTSLLNNKDQTKITSDTLNANLSNLLKLNILRNKIVYNEPKEEWMWLFKYITGEIPRYPILSKEDQLRSIWALNKSNYINQWTSWKNFYYQEFKKGITPKYELWQDKKPDKRYNVNNLKKRQYKHLKNIQRLRIFPQLKRGSYFALRRDFDKLRTLGIINQHNTIYESLEKSNLNTNSRPVDHLRETLKKLKKLATFNTLTRSKIENYNYSMKETKQSVSKFGIYYQQKPIMDTYSNWWEVSNNGWSWKTIQYGAPWDRKTLYIPTKITNKNLLNPPSGHTKNSVQNSFLPKTYTIDNSHYLSLNTIIIGTILLHICAILALVSLAELRYTSKVNIILFYKLSSVPYKIISSFVEPILKSLTSTINKEKNSLYFSDRQNKLDKGQFINIINKHINSNHQQNIDNNILNYSNIPLLNLNFNRSSHYYPLINSSFHSSNNTNIFQSYKISFYSVLKQIIKTPLRQNLQNKETSLKTIKKENNINQIFANYIFKSQPLAFKSLIGLSSLYLTKSSVNLGLWSYYSSIKLIETSIDSIRESARSVYDFFSLPENFSPNPDEVGLDVLANFIYDFEEPLIELLPDVIETQFEKYLNRCLLTLSILGPPGILLQHRMNWFYRMFVELFYKADADYLRDEQELQILYTIWADILTKAAEELDLEATVIASQEDQRLQLLDYLLNSNILESTVKSNTLKNSNKTSIVDVISTVLNKQTKNCASLLNNKDAKSQLFIKDKQLDSNRLVNTKFSNLKMELKSSKDFKYSWIKSKSLSSKLDSNCLSSINNSESQQFIKDKLLDSNSKTNYYEWSADQYLLYKTDETDLFLEINTPKSFSHIRSIKYCDTLHQPIGTVVCQMYSGIFIKQMAKNILIIGENTSEKSTIIQALAGETELKLILDNSSRYASVSQSVAVGMRMLRDVFEAVALQTPCIFVLEDIHLIGEKRPFLISDEDLALVTNSGLGLEQHQLYEKNQKIQQHSKHRISYFKKAYRGENSESLPTNLLCYDLFLKQLPRTEWNSPNYPLALDFHSDIDSSKLSFDVTGNQYSESSDQYKKPNSHLAIHEDSTNLASQGEPIPKVNHLVNETSWSSKPEETFSKKTELASIRTKVSTLADMSLANVSVKLDRITQLLVIMDNVRKNKGFIIFATTNKPQILDPALRRPGRLEETICFPSIPNLLNKWEILITNINPLKPNFKVSSSKQFTLDLVQSFLINNKAEYLFNQTNRTSFSQQKQILYTNINYKQEFRKTHNNRSLIRNLLMSTNIGRAHQSSIPNLKGMIGIKNFKTNILLPNELLVTSYENVGKQLIQIMYEQRTSNLLLSNISNNDNKISTVEEDIYMNLYSSKTLFKKEILNLFAGTVATYLATKKSSSMKSQIKSFDTQDFISTKLTSGNIDFPGIDTTRTKEWKLATKLIYSYIQKRAIYNKNTYVHKLLNMKKGSLTTFPSPPTTSLLLPTKRYENYLRAEKDYEQNNFSGVTLSIQEKIDLHIAQRVLKRLYKLPIKEFYKSEIIENSFTNFSSSTLTLPRESRNFSKHNKQSRTNFYYRNLFLKRHRNYLTNQWWNGHLTEYNVENTVMSEIDFRSCFVDKNILNGFVGDLVIDFPDADQHYNIKQRRWLVHSTSWKTWNDLEKGLSTDIISHYIFETFSRAYRVLDENRELLDNLVSKLMIKSRIQEIDTIENINNYI